MGLYEDLVDFLWDGAVPAEEIRKSGPDQSEVHVNSSLGASARKKKKAWDEKNTAQKIGLATSVTGAVSGPTAVYYAARSAKRNEGGVPRDMIRGLGGARGRRAAEWLDSGKSRPAKIAAGTAAAGMVALPAANWIGDAVNTRELSRTKKEMIAEVKKALEADLTLDNIVEIVEEIEKARNPQNIVRNAQRMVGGIAAGGIAATGYVAGRRATGDAVNDALDERGYPPRRRLVPRMQSRKKATNTDVVISSKYKPKSDVQKSDEPDLEWLGEISKVDTDQRHVFGWCSLSKVNGEPVVDRQDDYIPIEETEKAAYNYVLHSRKGGDMHQRDGEHPMHKSDMIESIVFTDDKIAKMGLPEDFPRGWWVGFKVNDDSLWDEVKDGKKVHFSVHGKGKRVPKEI